MKNNIYKHSFARRLTRWLMLVLFVMMAGLAYLIYEVVKMSMVEVVAVNFHDNMELSEKNICDALSDVSVAVENNIFDVEKNQPAIGCYPMCGPVFFGCQIRIYDKFFTNGGTTCLAGFNYSTKIDYELNNGKKEFIVKDMEIYSIETVDV